MEKIKIKDIFTFEELITNQNGIFSYLFSADDGQGNPLYPDLLDFITGDNYLTLDVDYEYGSSSEKFLSPLAVKLWDESGEDISIFVMGIGSIIANRFTSKWKHIWDALNIAYNPLENYSMLQTRTPDLTKGTTANGNITTESNSGIYGFNSDEDNPSGKVSGTQDSENSVTETETGTDTLTRSGNIGVTTSQQMLQSEFEVRKYDFYKKIYEDIDSILCLLSY